LEENIIYLVDAYAQIYRGYHAIKSLTTKDGKPSNAIFAIAKFLISLRKDFNPEYGAFVFDKGLPAERLAIHSEYKANRPGMPDDMRCQIETIRELIASFGWRIIETEGVEADDIIAAIAKKITSERIKILTNDKDISQVVDSRVTILAVNSFTKEIEERTPDKVYQKYGVRPNQIVDYLAMVGDSSDNITGLPGIGSKTASKLLEEFGSIANIYLFPEKLKTEKLRTLFLENKELLERNIKIITLDSDLELDKLSNLKDLILNKINKSSMERIAAEYELKSLHGIINEICTSTPVQEDLFNF